jgi:predicted esterase
VTPLGFVHHFEPATAPDRPVLLLLHGTGGSEADLLPLGARLAPGAALLSPRGKILERGMPRFFRRLSEGVFDLEDVRRRAQELGDFVAAAAERYGVDASRVVAVGYSNGANIAAALLLLRPQALAGAVLFRAMVPLVPEPLPALPATPVLLSNARADAMVAMEETERLAALLRSAGAAVTVAWQNGGHGLTEGDLSTAEDWIQESGLSRRTP